MDWDALQKKLLAAARAQPPGGHVPYAFEKRIMARLAGLPAADPWALWTRVLWRAAVSCIAVTCAATIWSVISQDSFSSEDSLAGELESTVLAPLAQFEEAL